MPLDNEQPWGFLKYEGAKVNEGILDARSAARSLAGLDSALRYLVSEEAPELGATDFPIPVLIRKGSWETLIPHDLTQWILTAGGLGLTTYLTTAAKKAAEHDFDNKGLGELFAEAFKGIRWLIKIGKHLGSFTYRQVEAPKWSNNNSEIGIPNEAGEHLFVPRKYFELYVNCPVRLLSDISSVVDVDCDLVIGNKEGQIIEVESVTIREKAIFCFDKPPDEKVIFPELEHGMRVALDGLVTRGNEVTNSIGFRYNEHILQCAPAQGSIVRYKQNLFLPCRITGTISRLSETGAINEPKPKIIFDDLKILDETPGQGALDL